MLHAQVHLTLPVWIHDAVDCDRAYTSDSDKVVIGREVRLRQVDNLEQAQDCHLVFVSGSEERRMGLILRGLAGRGVLTVSDIEGFAEGGGGIGLVTEDDRVRFDINQASLVREGLRASSQLLRLGRQVLGMERVRITDLWQEEDGLRVGEVEPLPPWQSGRLKADQHTLAKALQDVFNDYPEYAALYPEPDWDDASWVAQRWLEVLPIPVEQKQWLVAAKDNQPALSLLSGLLVASH